jgi:phage-related holin
MWLLVLIGAWIDILINYAVEVAGVDFTIPFVVATIVAVWLVVNEIISILENLQDIGVNIPPFLMPLMKNIKTKVEKTVEMEEEEDEDD